MVGSTVWIHLGYFIVYYLRDDKIDISFESDRQDNSAYNAAIVKVLDMLMAVLARKVTAKNAKL